MMEIHADLHSHTTCSDGILSPTDLVKKASDTGLSYLSITDHDTMEAHRLLNDEDIPAGLQIIPGIELSCTEGRREVHILGYYLDPQNEILMEYEETFRNDRKRRAEVIVNKLNGLKVGITMDDVMEKAGTGNIGRPHIAAALVDRGDVNDIQHAFDRYLDKGKPAFAARAMFSISEATQLIKQAGGVAVVAHPQRHFSNPRQFLTLIAAGIDGVEAYHPSHWPTTIDHYRSMAFQHELLVTGGSDFHGTRHYDEGNFGTFGVRKEEVDALHTRALQRQMHGR